MKEKRIVLGIISHYALAHWFLKEVGCHIFLVNLINRIFFSYWILVPLQRYIEIFIYFNKFPEIFVNVEAKDCVISKISKKL